MDNRPLDYASPHGTRIKGAPTPEQIQFRRRMRIGLLIAFILGLIPYPTQVLPSIKLQLTDPNGKPVTDVVSLRWHGYSNHEALDGHLQFDMSAQASVPRQRIWSSPFGRIANYLSAFLPHSGGFGSSASGYLEFNVPANYTLDAQAMGLINEKFWSTPDQSETWTIPQSGDQIIFKRTGIGSDRVIYWEIAQPGKWGASDYKLKVILKRYPANTTIPSTGK